MNSVMGQRAIVRSLGSKYNTPLLLAPVFSRSLTQQLSQKRLKSTSTEQISSSDNTALLNSQRRARPISPHFTIYEPQLTWLSSIFNRVTGGAMSGALYAFALGYAVGLPFDSATIIAFVKGLPVGVKVFGKALLALPFSFHFWNGLRHLSWDLGYFLTLKTSYQAGYAVLGLTAVSTVALALL